MHQKIIHRFSRKAPKFFAAMWSKLLNVDIIPLTPETGGGLVGRVRTTATLEAVVAQQQQETIL
jgi:hypothetical protein